MPLGELLSLSKGSNGICESVVRLIVASLSLAHCDEGSKFSP